ncbi:MAG: hypothetical protein HC906_04405 [Bacteroidales bacterium]|nr:hypothetical protein [Bacteroidales bacterium]
MKKLVPELTHFAFFIFLFFSFIVIGCEEEEKVKKNTEPFLLDDLTFDNYPRIDGSTSTEPFAHADRM